MVAEVLRDNGVIDAALSETTVRIYYMEHVFWLVPNLIAGRAGPNRQPWDLARLHQAGFGAVLSVNDGELCHPEDFKREGIVYARMPLSANAPPQPGDLEHCLSILPNAYLFLCSQIEDDRAVLVHCSSGKDRTCLLFAYFLMSRESHTPEEAIARVRVIRPIAFSAEGWEGFAMQILSSTLAKYPLIQADCQL
ncbi:MAG: dual specificity protein phosphatase family protein [Gammaproteobacteria bacterium]